MAGAYGAIERGRCTAALARGLGAAVLPCVGTLTGCPVDDRSVELSEVQGLFPGAADGGVVVGGAANTTVREVGVPELALSAESFEWGPLPTGFGGTKVLRISNTGNGVMSRPLVNLAEPVDPALSIQLNRCEQELQPTDSCDVRIQFLPSAVVQSSAQLSVDAGAAGRATVRLGGTGLQAGSLLLSPTAASSAEFGLVAVGETVTQTFTLINPGEGPSGLLEIFVNSPELALVDSGATDCLAGQRHRGPRRREQLRSASGFPEGRTLGV
jgi:hypothetical protein